MIGWEKESLVNETIVPLIKDLIESVASIYKSSIVKVELLRHELLHRNSPTMETLNLYELLGGSIYIYTYIVANLNVLTKF